MSSFALEAPNEADVDHIARSIVHAGLVVSELLGAELDGSKNDLVLIQRLLDSGLIEKESTYTLQSLGLAFGRVFIESESDYDWWMIDDEYGRDPAIRYREASLVFHPQTMISKRVEDDEPIDVVEMYESLRARLLEILEATPTGGAG